jgi:hypothetical protein
MKLPQGYTKIPSDYTGEVWLESQMRAVIANAKKEALLEAAEWFDNNPYHHFTNDSAGKLRRMAGEL